MSERNWLETYSTKYLQETLERLRREFRTEADIVRSDEIHAELIRRKESTQPDVRARTERAKRTRR